MKKILSLAFIASFVLAALALPAAVYALTCGVPGTEGMPTCNAKSNPNQDCCVPPQYKGVKTVASSGNKTPVMHHPQISAEAANASVVAQNNNNEPAAYAPTPSNVPTVSVTEVVAVQAVPAQTASGPSTPATPATSAAKAVSTSSGVKAK